MVAISRVLRRTRSQPTYEGLKPAPEDWPDARDPVPSLPMRD